MISRSDSPGTDSRSKLLSIRLVVSLGAAVMTGLSVLVLGFFAERSIREILLTETQSRMIAVAQDLAISASSELLTEYPQLNLHTLVKNIQREQPQLEMVVILDHERRIQGHQNPRLLGTSFESPGNTEPVHSAKRRDFEGAVLSNSELLMVTTPIMSTTGRHLGDVYLAVSNAHIEGTVLDARLKNLLVVAFCLIPGVLLTSLIMTRLLSPIGELKEGLRRIGEEDFDTPVEVRGITDLAVIADTINEAAGKLKTAKSEMVKRDDQLREAYEMLKMHITELQEEIVERKRVEKELRQSKMQLLQSQKMEAIGQLAGGIAHDFNNILTAISGNALLILQRITTEDKTFKYADEVRRSCDRAADLIRKLMTFSRKQARALQVIDVNESILEMERMLERMMRRNIKLEFRPDPGIQNIMADPSEVGQVIMNLVVNARDAMPPTGGQIVIETAAVDPGGSWVVVTVSDDGEGMDAETQGRIFEPFFTTKEKGKGTGLGLATVYGIVKQSGGRISVESEPGRGTTFTIRLPCVQEDAPAVISRGQVSHGGITSVVLVVEDEDQVRNFVETVLEEAGYEVLTAGNGIEAIEVVEKQNRAIDLVITDVAMPVMNGVELLEQLRERLPETRILFMSGFSGHSGLTPQILDESCGLMQKPFTPKALLERTQASLDRRKAA